MRNERDTDLRVITIDGPGGSGKSTVAKLVAEQTGLPYLDTGAMYRAITFGVLQRAIDPADWETTDSVLPKIDLDLSASSVMVDGVDATEAIRGVEVTAHVSAVAANPTVRQVLVELQRQWLHKSGGGVLEGRDIGTVVVPNAALKVYVTASVRERARRRSLETGTDIDEVEADLIRRDQADSERQDSPLRPAGDAVTVDTTGYAIAEVVDRIVSLAHERGLV
ncbi:MAG: (d)CMP kinase [Acidimicrobiaceae bacterium]|nr:(d)CMP kinase [Acidimicrobiaceae bacterium]